jgi:polyisoprenoid-binding protein YceI
VKAFAGRAIALLVLVVLGDALSSGAAVRTFSVDRSASRATIEVGKSGVFSFAAGHTHEVVAPSMSGTIEVDSAQPSRSSVRITIDAAALKVTGKGESASDVPKVQARMQGSDVLDSAQYPSIGFRSTNIAVERRDGDVLDLAVTGELTLRHTTRTVTVPVQARLDGGSVRATGRFDLKQTDYGITPVTVGGVVSVKDAVAIAFSIVGR